MTVPLTADRVIRRLLKRLPDATPTARAGGAFAAHLGLQQARREGAAALWRIRDSNPCRRRERAAASSALPGVFVVGARRCANPAPISLMMSDQSDQSSAQSLETRC